MVVGAIVASEDDDVDGISVIVTALNELIGEVTYQSCAYFIGKVITDQCDTI